MPVAVRAVQGRSRPKIEINGGETEQGSEGPRESGNLIKSYKMEMPV